MTLAGSSGRFNLISPMPQLPYDSELEYVVKESGVVGNLSTGIASATNYKENQSVPVITCSDSVDGCFIGGIFDGKNFFWGVSERKGGFSMVKFKFDVENQVYSDIVFSSSNCNGEINSEQIAISPTILPLDKEWRIFGGERTQLVGYCAIFKIVFIGLEEEIVAEIIPVRIGTVGYLYDKVNRRFLEGEMTGYLIPGPDKKDKI